VLNSKIGLATWLLLVTECPLTLLADYPQQLGYEVEDWGAAYAAAGENCHSYCETP